MIELTRLDGTKVTVNPNSIAEMQKYDSVIISYHGNAAIIKVRESYEQVKAMIAADTTTKDARTDFIERFCIANYQSLTFQNFGSFIPIIEDANNCYDQIHNINN